MRKEGRRKERWNRKEKTEGTDYIEISREKRKEKENERRGKSD